MRNRVTALATTLVALFTLLAISTPAFAATSATRWVGFYMPGVPSSMAALDALQAQVGTKAEVVNFFIADTEDFPGACVDSIVAEGGTPLITLEFSSTQNGGLATITNGSLDAYLKKFADAAKASGKTIWLRPFHEMNGDWYPWGATGGNTPAQLVAAYRHVHDIFADEGATNVKFVWCPNVDFDVSSFYPGDDYVDYAAIDGYNNGDPWRSFSDVFGATYNAVAAVSSKPIFIAETSCVESGSGKAAWITDMFDQISTTYTRIVGVCWFDASGTYDWRLETSAASLSAFGTSATSTRFTQSYTGAHRVAGTLSVKASAKSVKRKGAVKISGALGGCFTARTVKITISVARHRAISKRVRTSVSGRWSFTYKPTIRGKHYLYAAFTGDAALTSCASKNVRIVVK